MKDIELNNNEKKDSDVKDSELERLLIIKEKNKIYNDKILMEYLKNKYIKEIENDKELVKEKGIRIWVVPKNDLEAGRIISLLRKRGETVLVTEQKWGASWDKLEEKIKTIIEGAKAEGIDIYGVELQGNPEGVINIDHHVYGDDDRSNPKSSLEQVAEIIGYRLSIDEQFIAANDRGYIPAMEELARKMGISENDCQAIIQNIRFRDRLAQGVTAKEETEAEEAIERLGEIGEKRDYILVDGLPHSKTSTITDRLYGKYDNLLVTSQDGEVNFFGKTEIINMLNEKFPGGWSGGELDKGNGFWGGYPDQEQVKKAVQEYVEKMRKRENLKRKLSLSMASDLHEAWRKTRLRKDGTFEPRMKKTKDQAWIEKHGTNEVDIANCTFEELPSDWQYENLEAAKVAVNEVFDDVMTGKEISHDRIEEMSSRVHDAWLGRNSWVYDPEYGNPVLAKPYEELPEEEKAKDREQINQAKAKVENYLRENPEV